MNKIKPESNNYYFSIKPIKISTSQKTTLKKYKIGLYRDIQKIDNFEQFFTFSNQYHFQNIKTMFHIPKQANPQVILTLYAVQSEKNEQIQTQQGQFQIDYKFIISKMNNTGSHKFQKTDRLGCFELQYIIYISDNKNGINNIIGGDELSQSPKSKKLTKSITTIQQISNNLNKQNLQLGKSNSAIQSLQKINSMTQNKQEVIQLVKDDYEVIIEVQNQQSNIINKSIKKEQVVQKQIRQVRQTTIQKTINQDVQNEKLAKILVQGSKEKEQIIDEKGVIDIKEQIQENKGQKKIIQEQEVRNGLDLVQKIRYEWIRNKKLRIGLIIVIVLLLMVGLLYLGSEKNKERKAKRVEGENVKQNEVKKQRKQKMAKKKKNNK